MKKKIAKWAQCWSWCFKHPTNFGTPLLQRAPIVYSVYWTIRIEIQLNVGIYKKKWKMSLVLKLVLQASSQLCYSYVTEGPNTELNPLSHTHRHLPKCWENEKRNLNEPSVGVGTSSIQPTLEPTRYRGLHIEFNPLSHTYRNSWECFENWIKNTKWS
jgi:hypothetical protein